MLFNSPWFLALLEMQGFGKVSEQPFLSLGGWMITQERHSLADNLGVLDVVVFTQFFWAPIQYPGGFPAIRTQLWEDFSLKFLEICFVALKIGAMEVEDWIVCSAKGCFAVKGSLAGNQDMIQMEKRENSQKQALFIFWTTIQNQEHPKPWIR